MHEVAKNRNAVAQPSAEQLGHRLSERLTLDVPERAFDRGERGVGEDAPQPPARQVVEAVDVTVDVAGILAEEIGTKCLDDLAGRVGRIARAASRLAPADDSGIGLDLDEHVVDAVATPVGPAFGLLVGKRY